MQIRDIKCKITNVSRYTNWVFVLIETNQGILGLGESTLDGCEHRVAEAIGKIKHLYVGRNPVRDNLHSLIQPTDIAEAAALSGIDMALWDLRGKYYGAPVYQLLGGPKRKGIKMYATFNRTLKARTTDEFVKVSSSLVGRGFTGIKCAPFDEYTWQTAGPESDKYLLRGVERFASIRKELGDRIEIMVDNHWRFNYDSATQVADMLRAYCPYWYEAPISEKDGTEVKRVKDACGLRIAGAEMQTSLEQVETIFRNDALDVYMFDVKYIGGITGILAANRRVEKLGKMIAPHNMSGPVSSAASLQVSAVFDNLDCLEFHLEESDWVHSLSNLDWSLESGMARLPDGPGLGVELDLELLGKNPYKKTVPFRANMLGG